MSSSAKAFLAPGLGDLGEELRELEDLLRALCRRQLPVIAPQGGDLGFSSGVQLPARSTAAMGLR
jgi:hypothetical protein